MAELDTLISLGMKELLNHKDTHEAILEYIQALTKKNQPGSDWREVYWQQSNEKRLYSVDASRHWGVEGKIEKSIVTWVMRGLYSESERVGRLHAFLWSDRDYRESNIFMMPETEPVMNEVFIAPHYMHVVWKAFGGWNRAYPKFIEITEPLDTPNGTDPQQKKE